MPLDSQNRRYPRFEGGGVWGAGSKNTMMFIHPRPDPVLLFREEGQFRLVYPLRILAWLNLREGPFGSDRRLR